MEVIVEIAQFFAKQGAETQKLLQYILVSSAVTNILLVVGLFRKK